MAEEASSPPLWQVKGGPALIPRCWVQVGLPRECGDHRLDGPESAEWIKLFMFSAIYCGLLRADRMRLTCTLTRQIVGSSRIGLDPGKRKAAEAPHAGCLRDTALSPLPSGEALSAFIRQMEIYRPTIKTLALYKQN